MVRVRMSRLSAGENTTQNNSSCNDNCEHIYYRTAEAPPLFLNEDSEKETLLITTAVGERDGRTELTRRALKNLEAIHDFVRYELGRSKAEGVDIYSQVVALMSAPIRRETKEAYARWLDEMPSAVDTGRRLVELILAGEKRIEDHGRRQAGLGQSQDRLSEIVSRACRKTKLTARPMKSVGFSKYGFFRSNIFMNSVLGAVASSAMLDRIIAHEYIHIRDQHQSLTALAMYRMKSRPLVLAGRERVDLREVLNDICDAYTNHELGIDSLEFTWGDVAKGEPEDGGSCERQIHLTLIAMLFGGQFLEKREGVYETHLKTFDRVRKKYGIDISPRVSLSDAIDQLTAEQQAAKSS